MLIFIKNYMGAFFESTLTTYLNDCKNNLIRFFILFFIFLFYQTSFAAMNEKATSLDIGAPLNASYSFQSLDNSTITTDSISYPVLMNVFTTWCKLCKFEIKKLNEYPDYPILIINAGENQKKVARYVSKRGITLPVVIDQELSFINDMQIVGTTTVMIFDKDRKLIFEGNDLPKNWKTLLKNDEDIPSI